MNIPVKGTTATFRRRDKKKVSQISKSKHPGVQLTSEDSFQEENKILNTSKNAFLATSDLFEKALNELIIDNDEEVYETLLQLQDVIQEKLLTFKCTNEGRYESEYDRLPMKNLSSSKSLASSTLSLCSQKSVLVQSLVENNAYRKFLNEVNCPFCFKAQQDKIDLIKHLDENCQPLKNNEFEERNFMPFSAFQILPNNTIKCNLCHNSVLKNLKYFFVHLQSQNHKSEYSKAAKVKKYTECVYCSCCKILIPNNYTQLHFHMHHETHKSRSALVPQKKTEFLKNVDCVYLKNKKFKCLICPSRCVYQSIKDVLDHFENLDHGNKLKNGMFPNAFCEACMENVHIFELLSHLNSYDHIQKEKSAALQEFYETCYYCGFVCTSLKRLSVHMTAQCKEVFSIREQNLTAEKLHKNDIKNESKEQKSENSMTKNNMPTKGRENTKEGQHIIVKDNTDVLEVYKYFKKFGEITRVETYKEKNVLIHFRDKRAVQDALLLRDVIHINGVKMEITTDEMLTKSANAVKNLEKGIDSDEESLLETSDESHSDDSECASDPEPAVPNTKLENLFQRVSHHLSNSSKIFDYGLEEKILKDCAESLGQNREYSVIGFARTRLSFANEIVDLYCDVKEFSEMQFDKFPENLVKKFYIKLCNSSKFQYVNYHWHRYFHCIGFTHVATGKACRLTFTPSAKLLTDMLSYCIEKVDFAKNFCMIVRFWLAVYKLRIGELDFAVISLLVFFLVNKYVIGSALEICSPPNTVVFLCAKLTDYTAKLKQLRRDVNRKLPGKMSNVAAMFQEFLAFLCKFNFRKKMIVLPVDFGVPRKVIDNKEFDDFFKSFDHSELRESAMCVMDPLLSVNLTKDVSQDDLESLLQAARSTLRNAA